MKTSHLQILIYRIHQFSIWRYGSTLSGTLSLLFSPSGTKALMRQFVANAPKAHESLSTEARRVPVQGTPIPLISVFIAIFRLGTVSNDRFYTKIAELLGLTISISLDDSTTAGGAWHFCVGRLLLLRSKSGPGGTLYHYGLCEVAQRQAVLMRKDKPSDRAIKSDRAKVVMTAGCISTPHWHNDFHLQYSRK